MCGRLRYFILVKVIDVQRAFRGNVCVVIPVEHIILVQLGYHHRFIEVFACIEVVILHLDHKAPLVQRVKKQVSCFRFTLGIFRRQDSMIGLVGAQTTESNGTRLVLARDL